MFTSNRKVHLGTAFWQAAANVLNVAKQPGAPFGLFVRSNGATLKDMSVALSLKWQETAAIGGIRRWVALGWGGWSGVVRRSGWRWHCLLAAWR